MSVPVNLQAEPSARTSGQKFSTLASVLRMMLDADCSALKFMLQYILLLEPQHKAKYILLELIEVLEFRGTFSCIFSDGETIT